MNYNHFSALMNFEEQQKEQQTTLSKICKECGRYRKIPINFCNDCWKEMDKTINK